MVQNQAQRLRCGLTSIRGQSLPSTAVHIFLMRSGTIGLFGHMGTLLAHIQMIVDKQHIPQVFFCQAAFQLLFSQTAA